MIHFFDFLLMESDIQRYGTVLPSQYNNKHTLLKFLYSSFSPSSQFQYFMNSLYLGAGKTYLLHSQQRTSQQQQAKQPNKQDIIIIIKLSYFFFNQKQFLSSNKIPLHLRYLIDYLLLKIINQFYNMIHITKQQEPLYQELKEIEKEMRNAAEQAKIYENSHALLNKTIKKNELTMKQLQKMGGNRSIYVPLGRAFLRKDKESTIKEFTGANEKLIESAKEMEVKIKMLTEKANEKYKILREGTDRLTKK